MDDFERKHLRNWAEYFFIPEEIEIGIKKITAFVEEFPDVLQGNWSWPEIWDRGAKDVKIFTHHFKSKNHCISIS